MIPPKICHLRGFSTDERASLCALCGKALHMGKGEVALLQYYAKCADGFRPALQCAANALKQNRSQIYRNRQALERHGVIKCSDESICIDWERIRLFSTLDPEQTSKHCSIKQVENKKCNYKVYISGQLIQRLETCPLEQALRVFSSLTEQQYDSVRKYFRKKYGALYERI